MSVFQVQCFECKSSAYGSNKKDQAVAAWNTRPAAPVEGLETVEYQVEKNSKWYSDHPQSWAVRKGNGATVRELCDRSQSEAIIAAKDAEIERLQKINAMIMGDDENAPRYTTKRLKQEVERVTQVIRGEASDREAHVKTLEADNAALTARVKELEESSKKSGVCITCLTGSPEPYGCSDCLNTGWDGGCPPNSPEDIKMLFAGMISDFSKIKSRAEAFETQLAAARKALRNIAEDKDAPFRIKVHALATLEITHDPH